MMNRDVNQLSIETVKNILEILSPSSELISILPVEGIHPNVTHLVESRNLDGSRMKFMIRRYAVFGNYDRGEKARREFMALEFAYSNGIPVPKPFYLDEIGSILGSPGIVTEFVEGRHDMNPKNPSIWARAMAETLAKIHSLPCKIAEGSFILDADKEASWFLRGDKPPEFMRGHPYGVEVWNATRAMSANIKTVEPTLVHIDYWPGNILWRDGRIAAVLDWEEAAYGDPAIDVAYARMEMAILGLASASDEFLKAYKKAVKGNLNNLLFWELAACARPMFSPLTWDVVDPPRKTRFSDFLETHLHEFNNS